MGERHLAPNGAYILISSVFPINISPLRGFSSHTPFLISYQTLERSFSSRSAASCSVSSFLQKQNLTCCLPRSGTL